MAKHGKTRFQDSWLQEPDFKDWILKIPNDPFSARCKFCHADISIHSMGRQSLVSHQKGIKHRGKQCAFNSSSISMFVKGKSGGPNETVAITSNTKRNDCDVDLTQESTIQQPSVSGISKYLQKDEVTSAEIKLCLQTVYKHKSMRTAESDIDVFTEIFSDNPIASKIQLGRAKIGYMVVFGLAPYFKEELINKVRSAYRAGYPYVVGFDESLNKVAQKNQMDLNIQYWDCSEEQVRTSYLTSAFLGRSRASDLLEAFKECLSPLDLKKILQVSMDGPTVNFKFLKELDVFLKNSEESDTSLLNIGSCGLHTMHNAFKVGMLETGWEISKFLRSLYNLFHNVPARRAVYSHVTNSTLFPLKFCPVRWLLNGIVAQRAIEMLPHLRCFVREIPQKEKPACASFAAVEESVKDPLLGPKLAFFKTIANDIEPFLTSFQSDKPLAPFLFQELKNVFCCVQSRFLKSENVGNFNIDMGKEENLRPVSKLDVGFSTKKEIKLCKNVKDVDLLLFYRDCRRSLKTLLSKLLERSPLNYKLTKAISCWDPNILCSSVGEERFKNLLSIMVDKNWIDGHTADVAVRQFKEIVIQTKNTELLSFDWKVDRIDTFFMKILSLHKEIDAVKRVLIYSLLLSHGNASVERGFSINKELLVENMSEETIIAQRCVYNEVQKYGRSTKVPITKALLYSARCSRERYHEALKKKNQAKNVEEEKRRDLKRKKELVQELQEKKEKIDDDAKLAKAALDMEIAKLTQK